MTESLEPEGMLDVPAQVFERFVEALVGAGVQPDLVARLRKTLLVDKKFTESALKKAVLTQESAT